MASDRIRHPSALALSAKAREEKEETFYSNIPRSQTPQSDLMFICDDDNELSSLPDETHSARGSREDSDAEIPQTLSDNYQRRTSVYISPVYSPREEPNGGARVRSSPRPDGQMLFQRQAPIPSEQKASNLTQCLHSSPLESRNFLSRQGTNPSSSSQNPSTSSTFLTTSSSSRAPDSALAQLTTSSSSRAPDSALAPHRMRNSALLAHSTNNPVKVTHNIIGLSFLQSDASSTHSGFALPNLDTSSRGNSPRSPKRKSPSPSSANTKRTKPFQPLFGGMHRRMPSQDSMDSFNDASYPSPRSLPSDGDMDVPVPDPKGFQGESSGSPRSARSFDNAELFIPGSIAPNPAAFVQPTSMQRKVRTPSSATSTPVRRVPRTPTPKPSSPLLMGSKILFDLPLTPSVHTPSKYSITPSVPRSMRSNAARIASELQSSQVASSAPASSLLAHISSASFLPQTQVPSFSSSSECSHFPEPFSRDTMNNHSGMDIDSDADAVSEISESSFSLERKSEERFVQKEVIGEGSFGLVYRAYDQAHQQDVALKIHQDNLTVSAQRKLTQQMEIVRDLHPHPNILKYFHCFQDQGKLYEVSEFCKDGSLSKFVEKNLQTMNEAFIWRIVFQLACGLVRIHEANIIHMDIKPDNILVHEGTLKIGDFGLAIHVGDRFDDGDNRYLPPEQLNEQTPSFAYDIFSLGVTLFEITCQVQIPSGGDFYQKLRSDDTVFPVETPFPLSHELRSLILRMLRRNPHERPTARDIMCIAEDVCGVDEPLRKQLSSWTPQPKHTKSTFQSLMLHSTPSRPLSARSASRALSRSFTDSPRKSLDNDFDDDHDHDMRSGDFN